MEKYLKSAHGNCQKVLAHRGVVVRLLREVDAAFLLGSRTLKAVDETIVGAFVASSYSSWLAGANLVLASHLSESFQPLRACVESAFYAFRIKTDRSSWERWKHRPTVAEMDARPDEAGVLRKTRKDVGREFSVGTIAASFPSSARALRDRAVRLYDELIDHGAHFNFPALRRSYKHTGVGEDHFSAIIKIINGSESDRAFCFTKATEVGVTVLEVLDLAIDDEWDSAQVRSAIGRIQNSLRKRPKERLARRI